MPGRPCSLVLQVWRSLAANGALSACLAQVGQLRERHCGRGALVPRAGLWAARGCAHRPVCATCRVAESSNAMHQQQRQLKGQFFPYRQRYSLDMLRRIQCIAHVLLAMHTPAQHTAQHPPESCHGGL